MYVQKEYKTVLQEAIAEHEEKKSRFIATVRPVTTEEQAVEFINGLRSKYWDATHNVYAYSIGGETSVQRFSDDGEPSGTAGLPMLEVIKRRGVQDVAVVVTRYFGGTLLGAAGLIRAYGKGAVLGLEAAGIITRRLCAEVKIIVEYTLFGKVQNLLLTEGYPVKETVYEQDVEITVYVDVDHVDRFIESMTEATNARCILAVEGKSYVTLSEEGKLL